jgi:hypothetical protein
MIVRKRVGGAVAAAFDGAAVCALRAACIRWLARFPPLVPAYSAVLHRRRRRWATLLASRNIAAGTSARAAAR